MHFIDIPIHLSLKSVFQKKTIHPSTKTCSDGACGRDGYLSYIIPLFSDVFDVLLLMGGLTSARITLPRLHLLIYTKTFVTTVLLILRASFLMKQVGREIMT